MKKVVVGVLVGALGMFAWQRVMQPAPAAELAYEDQDEEPAAGISLERNSSSRTAPTLRWTAKGTASRARDSGANIR